MPNSIGTQYLFLGNSAQRTIQPEKSTFEPSGATGKRRVRGGMADENLRRMTIAAGGNLVEFLKRSAALALAVAIPATTLAQIMLAGRRLWRVLSERIRVCYPIAPSGDGDG